MYVDRSGVNTDKRTTYSQEGSPVGRRKSLEIKPVVHMVEGSPTEHSKSQESDPISRTISYTNILRINILPS